MSLEAWASQRRDEGGDSWRRRVGIEPTFRRFRAETTVLKTAGATRPHSPPSGPVKCLRRRVIPRVPDCVKTRGQRALPEGMGCAKWPNIACLALSGSESFCQSGKAELAKFGHQPTSPEGASFHTQSSVSEEISAGFRMSWHQPVVRSSVIRAPREPRTENREPGTGNRQPATPNRQRLTAYRRRCPRR